MEKLDLLILKYLSEGLLIGEISGRIKTDESMKVSKSTIEKRLNVMRKLYSAKTLFHLAVISKENKLI